MKRILALLSLFVLAPLALAQRQSITLDAPPPPAVRGVTVRASTPGLGNFCWWVVATYPIGNAPPSQPACSGNMGGTVTITWPAAPGATTYDVLRTNGPSLPSGAASIAVATAVSSTSQTDTLGALSSYTITTAAAASASIALDNQNQGQPQLNVSPGLASLGGAPLAASTLPCGSTNYGDSTMQGAGASEPRWIFGAQLRRDIPGNWINFGFGGSYSLDISTMAWETWTPTNTLCLPLIAYEAGINDANFVGNTTGGVNNFTLTTMAGIRHLGIPIANQFLASTATNSGFTSFTNSNFTLPVSPGTSSQFQSGTMMQSNGNGNTLTWTIAAGASGKIGLTWLADDAASGTFTVSLNGTLQTSTCSGTTTFNMGGCNGQSISRNNGFAPFSQEFAGSPNANNTLVVTSTNTGLVIIVGADAVPTSTGGEPYIAIQGVLKEYTDTASAATAAYNAAMQTIYSTLFADGLTNLIWVDVRGGVPGVNTTTDYVSTACAGGSTPLHPNDCGYRHLVQTYESAFRTFGVPLYQPNFGSNAGYFAGPIGTMPNATASSTNPYEFDWQVNPNGSNTTSGTMPGICSYGNHILTSGNTCNGRLVFEYDSNLGQFVQKVWAGLGYTGLYTNTAGPSRKMILGAIGDNAYSSGATHIGWSGTTNSGSGITGSGWGLSIDSQTSVGTSASGNNQALIYFSTASGNGSYSLQGCKNTSINGLQQWIKTSSDANSATWTANAGNGDTVNGASSITFHTLAQWTRLDFQCSQAGTAGSTYWTVNLVPGTSGN